MSIYLYGLQRSGTNVLTTWLQNNFNIKIKNIQEPNRKSINHKHSRIYDQKQSIPIDQYYNNHKINSITDLDKLLHGKHKYIVIIKDIYEWLPSILRWAKKCNWPLTNKLDYVEDYMFFLQKWLSIKNDRVLIIYYKDFLIQNQEFINNISKFLNKPVNSQIINKSKVTLSTNFNNNRKKYYLNKLYLKEYTKDELKVIDEKIKSIKI